MAQKNRGCHVQEGEGVGEGGCIAREGIEHSRSRQLERCIPCHADVVGDLVGRVAAKAKLRQAYLCYPTGPKPGINWYLFFIFLHLLSSHF